MTRPSGGCLVIQALGGDDPREGAVPQAHLHVEVVAEALDGVERGGRLLPEACARAGEFVAQLLLPAAVELALLGRVRDEAREWPGDRRHAGEPTRPAPGGGRPQPAPAGRRSPRLRCRARTL